MNHRLPFRSNPAPVDTARRTTADTDERYPKVVIGLNSDPQNLSPDPNAASKPYIFFEFYECLFDLKQ